MLLLDGFMSGFSLCCRYSWKETAELKHALNKQKKKFERQKKKKKQEK